MQSFNLTPAVVRPNANRAYSGKAVPRTCSIQADSASGHCQTYQTVISAQSVNKDRRLPYHDSAVPALRDSLADTSSEGGWGHVAAVGGIGIGRGCWLADDELVLRYTGCGDLEQGSVRPCTRGSSEQTGAGGIFSRTLCQPVWRLEDSM